MDDAGNVIRLWRLIIRVRRHEDLHSVASHDKVPGWGNGGVGQVEPGAALKVFAYSLAAWLVALLD